MLSQQVSSLAGDCQNPFSHAPPVRLWFRPCSLRNATCKAAGRKAHKCAAALTAIASSTSSAPPAAFSSRPLALRGVQSMVDLASAWSQVLQRLPPCDSSGQPFELIISALKLSLACLQGAPLRTDGRAPTVRAVQLATMLADLCASGLPLDAEAMAAAIVADAAEAGLVTSAVISNRLGAGVGSLVHDILRVRSAPGRVPLYDDNASSAIREWCLAVHDVRACVVEVVCRWDELQHMRSAPLHEQQAVAMVALQIHAPLGHAMGMGAISCLLEDLCFQVLFPSSYLHTSGWLRQVLSPAEDALFACQAQLLAAVDEDPRFRALADSCVVRARTKSLYSIMKKLLRLGDASKGGRHVWQVFDLLGMRAIVLPRTDLPRERSEELAKQACYVVEDVAMRLWPSIQDRRKDYIAAPKDNGYQSLHLSLQLPSTMQTSSNTSNGRSGESNSSSSSSATSNISKGSSGKQSDASTAASSSSSGGIMQVQHSSSSGGSSSGSRSSASSGEILQAPPSRSVALALVPRPVHSPLSSALLAPVSHPLRRPDTATVQLAQPTAHFPQLQQQSRNASVTHSMANTVEVHGHSSSRVQASSTENARVPSDGPAPHYQQLQRSYNNSVPAVAGASSSASAVEPCTSLAASAATAPPSNAPPITASSAAAAAAASTPAATASAATAPPATASASSSLSAAAARPPASAAVSSAIAPPAVSAPSGEHASPDGPCVELQIRTLAMDLAAESGEAAHTAYKGGLDSRQARQLQAWTRQLQQRFVLQPKGQGVRLLQAAAVNAMAEIEDEQQLLGRQPPLRFALHHNIDGTSSDDHAMQLDVPHGLEGGVTSSNGNSSSSKKRYDHSSNGGNRSKPESGTSYGANSSCNSTGSIGSTGRTSSNGSPSDERRSAADDGDVSNRLAAAAALNSRTVVRAPRFASPHSAQHSSAVLFDVLDRDGNGLLDLEELCFVLKEMGAGGEAEARLLLALLDANADGSLTLEEWGQLEDKAKVLCGAR